LPPEAPAWARHVFDMKTFTDVDALNTALLQDAQAHNKVAYVGEDPSSNFPVADANPTLLINRLHYQRAYKTEFEIDSIRQATAKAVTGHVAAREAFVASGSEFQIQSQYLNASLQTATDLPYANIVALNEHAAVLHYQHYDRSAPDSLKSFLIDAGARHLGYAADITRTYSADASDRFGELIEALDEQQQALVATIRPGIDYLELHIDMHRRLGNLLADFKLVKCSGDDAFESGITRSFLPHGLGHLLGLQTHDVAGQQRSADGGQQPPPEEYAALRLTRRCESSMVFTIEPGLYFIPMLLDALRRGPLANEILWPAVEALLPFGGIRIEDNVLVTEEGHHNLTRMAFAAHG
jgi:Xaa-Pro dipeptidase